MYFTVNTSYKEKMVQTNLNTYSVSVVTKYIKKIIQNDFLLKNISVKGEVSNCKYHSTGHIYFSIKDESSVLNCIMFAGSRIGLSFQMKDGDKVCVTGGIDIYERDGSYRLYAREITNDGIGNLYIEYQRLKKELEEMGMFSQQYKKPIPAYVKSLGVITAPTGAAIRDILSVSRRRNPYIEIVLYPALVQGVGAKESIVKGLKALDGKVDLIILGRGGGSIEDLWPFNEEEVARAIFASNTPIISAVGHETDFTISDFVADKRAPTPSAAAELGVIDVFALLNRLDLFEIQLDKDIYGRLNLYREKLEKYEQIINAYAPSGKLEGNKELLKNFEEKLNYLMLNKLKMYNELLSTKVAHFEGASPLKKLNSGFGYLFKEDNKRITSVKDVNNNEIINIALKDGAFKAKVIK